MIRRNAGASLYDIGDGVLCVEFHTKMNTIDADIVAMLMEGVDLAEKEFAGLVIANHAENFCAGANLMLVFLEAQNKQFDNIETMVKGFQDACMRLRYSGAPVVAAPAGMALGGGAEMCLGADRIRAAAETYMGLVEVGVGLLPAGGGLKEMAIRHLEGIPDGVAADPLPFLRKAFETVGMAKVSTSAKEARELGFLRPTDRITLQRDFLIQDAKNTVLAMNREGYEMPEPRSVALPGPVGLPDVRLRALHDEGGGADQRARREDRPEDRLRADGRGRPAGDETDRTGAARPGARGVPLPLRRGEDPGADPVHADEGRRPLRN